VSLSWRVFGPVLFLAGLSVMAPAQTPVTFTTHTQPLKTNNYTDISNAVAVDVNNDGVPDLVMTETPPNLTTVLSVSIANGDGTFQPQREELISSSSLPTGPLFFGDFNNDGKADIGMLTSLSQPSGATATIAILLGNGDGTFQPIKLTTVAPGTSTNFEELPIIGDYNHDGNQDLVAYLNGGIDLFPGDGKGGFGAGKVVLRNLQAAPQAGGDFDGDGNADIAYIDVTGSPCTVHDPPCATDLHVLYGDGKFGFKDVKVYHSGAPFDVRSGDLNSDGRTDIFLFDESNGLNLVALYGQSSRTFTKLSMPSGPVGSVLPAMADMNGDGHMDLVVYGQTQPTTYNYDQYVVFLGNGNGGFTRENELAPAFAVAPSPPLVVDVNRDNKPDILEPAATPEQTDLTLVVALNRSTGNYFPFCPYPAKGSGIHFCLPAATAVSPVRFTAAANSFGQTRKIELWLDGRKAGEQFSAWGQRAWFSQSFGLLPGVHRVTFFEADTDNRLQKATYQFTLAGCAAPSSPGVHICLPANNGTFKSPVLVQATATTEALAFVQRMELWVDGVKKVTAVGTASFGDELSLTPGKHRIVVIAVVSASTKYSSAVYVTVN